MKDRSDSSGLDPELEIRIAAGRLASGVAAELVRPLRELREELAVMVQQLDRHVIESKGPAPYPWKGTREMREQLAHSYLLSRRVTRLAGELAEAISTQDKRIVEVVDINKLVEAAINLARHRVAADTEVFIDLGAVPLVRVVPSELVLTLSGLISIAAESARGVEGAAISIKTRKEPGADADGDYISIYLADSGTGRAAGIETASLVAERTVAVVDGEFFGTIEPGQGSVFELRLRVGR